MTNHIFPFENCRMSSDGIETRDFIAIMAMQGILANPAFAETSYSHIATMAYEQADAMIKESEKK